MSKERLEEIKNQHKLVKESLAVIGITNDYDDLGWLIEQAERAQSLQEQLDAKIMLVNRGDEEERYAQQEKIMKIEQQNKHYREALKFYADSENYDYYKGTGPWKRIENDYGEKAREALEGEE